MRRAGSTEVGDLQVTANELTPVSEPLYSVACLLVGRWGQEIFPTLERRPSGTLVEVTGPL